MICLDRGNHKCWQQILLFSHLVEVQYSEVVPTSQFPVFHCLSRPHTSKDQYIHGIAHHRNFRQVYRVARKFRVVDFPPDQELVSCDVGKRLYLLKSKHLQMKIAQDIFCYVLSAQDIYQKKKRENFILWFLRTEIGHHLLFQQMTIRYVKR